MEKKQNCVIWIHKNGFNVYIKTDDIYKDNVEARSEQIIYQTDHCLKKK